MRLAVLADIHGNLPALEAVIADMAAFSPDLAIDLGDCVSGPLWPRETLARLQELGWPTVRGNHDRAVGSGPREALGLSDRYGFDQLSATDRAWLHDLPPRLSIDEGIVAFHARPENDEAYLLEDQHGGNLVAAAPTTVARRLGAIDARLVLHGHSHQQRVMTLPDGPTVLNPGSVGCPAYHDDATDPPHVSEAGSPAARYALVDQTPRGFTITLRVIPYDHAAAAARAAANDRPDWAYALRTGFVQPNQVPSP